MKRRPSTKKQQQHTHTYNGNNTKEQQNVKVPGCLLLSHTCTHCCLFSAVVNFLSVIDCFFNPVILRNDYIRINELLHTGAFASVFIWKLVMASVNLGNNTNVNLLSSYMVNLSSIHVEMSQLGKCIQRRITKIAQFTISVRENDKLI